MLRCHDYTRPTPLLLYTLIIEFPTSTILDQHCRAIVLFTPSIGYDERICLVMNRQYLNRYGTIIATDYSGCPRTTAGTDSAGPPTCPKKNHT
jgi:hypothetical protein